MSQALNNEKLDFRYRSSEQSGTQNCCYGLRFKFLKIIPRAAQ
jgi:hypothetical protein